MEPFPHGMAATNRLLSYLKGIAKCKRVMYLTICGPVQGFSPNTSHHGKYCEIDYSYFGKTNVDKLPNKIVRAFRVVWRRIKLCHVMIFKYSYHSVLIYSPDPLLAIMVRVISWIKNAKMYSDNTEMNLTTISGRLRKTVCRSFDGVIVISAAIDRVLDNIGPQKKFLLPVLVDIDRFNIDCDKHNSFFYCSGGNLERDGLLDILRGFILFCSKHSGYTLEIAAPIDNTNPYNCLCKEIIDANQDTIHYLGCIPSIDIPKWMCSAKALMITPHARYKTFGFPTKLGEYLASGVPTICSTIEDFKGIVTDKIAFLVEPNFPQQIAEQLTKITTDENHAFEIATNAREFIWTHYTFDIYREKLLSFLSI